MKVEIVNLGGGPLFRIESLLLVARQCWWRYSQGQFSRTECYTLGSSIIGAVTTGDVDKGNSCTKDVGQEGWKQKPAPAVHVNAYQMPTSKRPSNAQDAASQKSLAKCENPLCLRHFGEHWLILWALSLTQNGGMIPGVEQVRKP